MLIAPVVISPPSVEVDHHPISCQFLLIQISPELQSKSVHCILAANHWQLQLSQVMK